MPSGVLLVGVVAVGGWGGSDDPQPSGSQIGSQAASLQGYLATRPGQVLYARWARAAPQGAGRRSAAVARLPAARGAGLRHRRPKVPCSGPWADRAMGPAMCARALSSPPVVREEGLPPVRG